MEQKKIRKRIVVSGIVTALLGIGCLILPTGDDWYSGTSYINALFPGVSDQTILVLFYIRLFLLETLFWGVLTLFALGCFDAWLTGQGRRPQTGRTAGRVLRVLAVVLAAVLLYWSLGFIVAFLRGGLLPVPAGISMWLMNNRMAFGALWCLDAVLWQFSLWKDA